MILKRATTQSLEWLDIENNIWQEETVIEWYILGIRVKTRKLSVTQVLPNGAKPKIGFGPK